MQVVASPSGGARGRRTQHGLPCRLRMPTKHGQKYLQLSVLMHRLLLLLLLPQRLKLQLHPLSHRPHGQCHTVRVLATDCQQHSLDLSGIEEPIFPACVEMCVEMRVEKADSISEFLS